MARPKRFELLTPRFVVRGFAGAEAAHLSPAFAAPRPLIGVYPICTLRRAGVRDAVTRPFVRQLGRPRWTHRAQRAVPSMTLNRYQEKRRKVLRGRRALHERAPTNPDRGIEMPTRPQGLDPIVAEIIEALARTIIRDDDHRASSTPTDKNG
jgi:hypothetical protein